MSYSTSIRRPLPSISKVFRRRISRDHGHSRTGNVQSHRTLPPAKMRALISLYHQTDTFITPETLSDRINDALLPNKSSLAGPWITPDFTMTALSDALRKRQSAPKLSQWNEQDSTVWVPTGKSWSNVRKKREWRVIEAMYGVDATLSGQILPGLETLEESVESLRAEAEDDANISALENRKS